MDADSITGPHQNPSVQNMATGEILKEGRHAEHLAPKGSASSKESNMNADLVGTIAREALEVAKDPPPEVTKQVLTAGQRRLAGKLRKEFERQTLLLQNIIEKQILLTGQDPISKDEAASKTVEKATASGTPIKANGVGPPVAVTGTSPAAKTSRLSPESEAVLLTLFGVQDTLGREDAQVLANQAGCSESQVREYFTKLRSNVRAFMQKLQRKVSAAEAPSAAADLLTSSPTAPQLPLSGSSAPAALGGTPAAPPMHPQFTPQSAAQSAPALSATANGGSSASLQPSVAAAGFPQSQAATPARPAGAGQPHASPMTATDLRTMLTNAASASSASASLAEEAVAAAVAGTSMVELESLDAARKAGLVELQRYLDENGGVASAKHAGPVALLMARAASAEVREALLHALMRTASSQVLAQLAGSGRALDTLDDWAGWAEQDKQSTVLRLLLSVLQRLPVPIALLKNSSLQKTIGRLQKYRTRCIATAATALLSHWYHLEQPIFQAAAAPMRPPPPPVRVSAPAQPVTTGHPESAAPQWLASVQLQVFKPGTPVSAGRQPPQQLSAPAPAPVQMAFQQSHGQAELLKPSNTFYRGMAGRLGSLDKSEQAQSPRKVLSADEIVRAKEKERSRLAGAAGLSGRPGPSKSSRLDNNSLLDVAAKRRANLRPSSPHLLPSQGRTPHAVPPAHQQGLVGNPQQPQLQQQPWQLPQQPQLQRQPGHMPHAGASAQPQLPAASHHSPVALSRAVQYRPPQQPQQAAQGPAQQPQPRQEAPEWRPNVAWTAPQSVQALQRERPGSGEESEEAATQRACNMQQPGVSYRAPELIPASPAEPEGGGQDVGAGKPAKLVPILPTDLIEQAQQLQALQDAGFPVDLLLGL